MTRYSNPLPPNQVPPSQGRPAGSAQRPQHGAHPEPDYTGWPAQQRSPRQQPASNYADASYPQEPLPGAQHDPYAALRPDGYGYGQPQQSPTPDPYGLAGYTPPQTSAPQHGYAPRSPQQTPAATPVQPSFDPYAAPAGDRYGANDGYGASPQHGGRLTPASFGTHETPAAPQANGYGAQSLGYGNSPAAPQGAVYGGGYDSLQGTSPGLADPYQPWNGGGQGIALDPQDYQGQPQGYPDPSLGGPAQWGNDPYGTPQVGAGNGVNSYAGGYAQPQGGSFDQSYADDDAQYEDEPRRGGWKKVAVLVGCMVVVGGVLTVGYNSIMGSGSGGPTPLVRTAEGPSKVKPSEPGGKQFDHTDSKIMGRLSEGGTSSSDQTGVRKVPVVTVGRDGSIQPPGMIVPEEETRATVAVPGLTVIDGLGPSPNRPVSPGASQGSSPPVQMVTAGGAARPMVVEPPAKKAKVLAGSADADASAAAPAWAAVTADAPPSPPPAKKERVAAADPSPAATSTPKPTGAGYVAVLASVPASDNSRINALTQFADLQQKYGTILSNKTPDIREANLGEKGTYHRLMVGPPGSRDSANSVCSQLKAEGYSGCWVTAY